MLVLVQGLVLKEVLGAGVEAVGNGVGAAGAGVGPEPGGVGGNGAEGGEGEFQHLLD